MSSDEFVVTPWNVEGDIDYEKLTKQFGTQKISPEILSKIKKITGEDHFMLRRGIFFSHRDLNVILENWNRPNGLNIKRETIPIGVIGVIYESRPNVTSDVAGLCFKSGNAVILKGGSEAINTNRILAKLFRQALRKNNVDENYIQFVDSKDRKMVDIMLSKMKKYIDVIIPRGGKNLVKRVQDFSTVPIIGHLEGICHTFIDKDAELNMASSIIYNAKLRNTAICGATETILFHNKIVKKFCNPILKKLEDENCKIYGDNILRKYYNGKVYPAKEKDWSTEYLTAAVSVKVVKKSISVSYFPFIFHKKFLIGS